MRRLQLAGIPVGLGSDISGGHTVGMCHAFAAAATASRVLLMGAGPDERRSPMTLAEGFHMLTQGGANALGLGACIGSFERGKQFDAVLIDTAAADSPMMSDERDTVLDCLSRFFYTGDDRNVSAVYVGGRRVV